MKTNTTIISGVIHSIFPEERYGDFIKRVLWVQELNEKYPEMWAIELWHDDTTLLNKFKNGDIVQCVVTIKGRMWSKGGRDYVITTLKCDSINKI